MFNKVNWNLGSFQSATFILLLSAPSFATEVCLGPWLPDNDKQERPAPLIATEDERAVIKNYRSKHDVTTGDIVKKLIKRHALDECELAQCGNHHCKSLTRCYLPMEYHDKNSKQTFLEICCSDEANIETECLVPKNEIIEALQVQAALDLAAKVQSKENELLSSNGAKCLTEPSRLADGITRAKSIALQVVAPAPNALRPAVGHAVHEAYNQLANTPLSEMFWHPLDSAQKIAASAGKSLLTAFLGRYVSALSNEEADALSKLKVRDLLNKIKAHFNENKQYMTQTQKTTIAQLLGEAEDQLNAVVNQRKKERDAKIGGPVTIKSGMDYVRHADPEPSVADVILAKDTDSQLGRLIRPMAKLEQIANLPIKPRKFTTESAEKTELALQDSLATWPEKFRNFLKDAGSQFSFFNGDERFFNFVYGQFGTGKTEGIRNLASSYGVDSCVIDSDDVMKYIDEFIKQKGPNDIPTDLLVQAYQFHIVKCLKTSESLTQAVIFDDFDKTLHLLEERWKTLEGNQREVEVFQTKDKPAEVKQNFMRRQSQLTSYQVIRDSFFNHLKNWVVKDSSGKSEKPPSKPQHFSQHASSGENRDIQKGKLELIDPDTGFPLSTKGLILFGTANTDFPELGENPSETWKPLIDRTKKIQAVPAGETERRNFIEVGMRRLKAKLLEKNPHLDLSQLDESVCRAKLTEIVEYDIQKGKLKIGFRPLNELVNTYTNKVAEKVGYPNPCSATEFDAKQAALFLNGYNLAVAQELKDAQFNKLFEEYKHQFDTLLASDSFSHEFKNAIHAKLEHIRKETIPTDAKIAKLEDLRNLAITTGIGKDFDNKTVLEDVKNRFLQRYSALRESKAPEAVAAFKDLGVFVNAVINKNKLSNKNTGNQLFQIYKKSSSADSTGILELGEVLGLPVCVLNDKAEILESQTALWTKFKTDIQRFNQISLRSAIGPEGKLRVGNTELTPVSGFVFDQKNKVYKANLQTKDEKPSEFVGIITNTTNLEEPSPRLGLAGPESVYIMPAADFAAAKPEEEMVLTWIQSCLRKHPKNFRQSIVVLDLPPEVTPSQKTNFINKCNDAIRRGIYMAPNGDIADLSKVTLMVNAGADESWKFPQVGQSRFSLRALPIELRGKLARNLASQMLKEEGLDPTGKLTLETLPHQDQKLLEDLIEFDRYQASIRKGDLPTTPLKQVLREVWLPEVKAKLDDTLGIMNASEVVERRYEEFKLFYDTFYLPVLPPRNFPEVSRFTRKLISGLNRRYKELGHGEQLTDEERRLVKGVEIGRARGLREQRKVDLRRAEEKRKAEEVRKKAEEVKRKEEEKGFGKSGEGAAKEGAKSN